MLLEVERAGAMIRDACTSISNFERCNSLKANANLLKSCFNCVSVKIKSKLYNSHQNLFTTTTTITMSDDKGYIVTLKDDTSDKEAESIKNKIKDLGGKITNEFSLIKGFSIKLPKIHADSLHKESPNIASVEEDKEVHTQ